MSFVVATCVLLLSCCAARSQSFSVSTAVTPDGVQYVFGFTLNYDQTGAVQSLADNMWDWTFYMDPSIPIPTAVALPTGWKYAYDTTGGEFDFYTEGPGGFGNGDFGPDVILPGESLSGFGLTSPAAPDLSIAFTTDEQYNQDANIVTLPTTVPAPEPSAYLIVGLGTLLLGVMAYGRWVRSRHKIHKSGLENEKGRGA